MENADNFPFKNLDGSPEDADQEQRSVFHQPDEVDGLMTRWMTILLLILGIITIMTNLGVVVRVFKLKRKIHDVKPAFYFIGNLAVSDLMIGSYIVIVFCIDLAEFSTDWRDSCCGLLTAISVTAIQETIFSIMLIGIDKYVFICHPLKYREIVSKRKVCAGIALSWILSILIGWMPAMGLQDEWSFCNFVLYISEAFAILLLLTAVLIPLVVISIMYGFIMVLAIKMTRTKLKAKSESSSGSSSVLRLSFVSRSTRSSKLSRTTVRTSPSDSGEVGSNDTPEREVRNGRKQSTSRPSPENHILINDSTMQAVGSLDGRHTFTPTTETVYINDTHEGQPLKTERVRKDSNARGLSTVYEESSDDYPDAMDSNRNSVGSRTNKVASDHSDKRISPIRSKGSYDLSRENSYRAKKKSGHKNKEVTLTNVIALNDQYETARTEREQRRQSCGAEDEEIEDPIPSFRFSQRWRKKSYYRKVLSETKDKVEFLKKCKAIKTVLMIIGSFMVTYVPFVVGTLVYKTQDDKSDGLFRALNNLLYCAVVANSLLNPLIYAYGFKEFRVRTEHLKGICAVDKRRERARRI